jgi:hypothetical protein
MRTRSIALLASLLVAGNAPTAAQVKKGDIEVGFSGSIDWGSMTRESGRESEEYGLGVNGHAGFFVTDHLDVGGAIGFGYSRSRSDYDDTYYGTIRETSDSYTYGIGPEINYHFMPANRVVPFVGGAAWYSRSQSSFEYDAIIGSNETSASDTYWNLGVHGGADFFLNEHVSVKLMLEYLYADRSTDDQYGVDYQSDSVRLGAGLSIFLHPRDRSGTKEADPDAP